jgi:hypothetical protein
LTYFASASVIESVWLQSMAMLALNAFAVLMLFRREIRSLR